MIKSLFSNFSLQQSLRIKKNFISFFSNFFSKIFVQIAYPPLMILIWGVENFGIWIFLTAIPSSLSVLNLNFSQAARVEMTLNNAKKNKKLVNINFQNGLGLIIMNMIIFTIVWFLFYIITDLDFKIFENIKSDELRLTIFLIILSFYFSIFDSILSTGISYWGKLYIYTYIKLISDILLKLFILIIGLFFENLLYASVIFLAVSAIRTIILFYYFLLNKKYVYLSFKYLNFKHSVKLFKLSFSYYAETFIQIIKHNGIIILLGIYFSAEIIGLISTAKTLFYFLPIFFIAIFNHTGMYEYSESIGKKFFKFVKKVFKLQFIISLLIIAVFILFSIIFGPIIYNFWTNNNYELEFFLLLIIIFDASFNMLQSTVNTILKSVNKFLKPIIIEAIICFVAILISYNILNLGYNFKFVLLINLISTVFSFFIFSFFSIQFLRKLKIK